MGGAAVEIARRRAAEVKQEMSGSNFPEDGAYALSPEVSPYVPSSSPLSPGDTFSPKAQQEVTNPPPSEVIIQKGQDNSQFLPKTTGTTFSFSFKDGRPNFTLSVPNGSYTDIANSFIQAILTGQNPSFPPNITTTATINPPRDSSGDRGGAAAVVVSPSSNATPNTTSTTTESSKIRL